MKSFAQIKNLIERGDYGHIAVLAKCSRKNVELIIKGQRPDNYNVQEIADTYLATRIELARIYRKNKRQEVAA